MKEQVINCGTVWTEPGQGATLAQIDRAIQSQDLTPNRLSVRASEDAMDRLLRRIQDHDTRTNLSLTGAPLTAEDVKRIAGAK